MTEDTRDVWDQVEHKYADANPVLMFHGLEDQALLPGALNGTWQWVEQDLTILTVPGASHFVQQDAAETVSNTMVDWLSRRKI